MSRAKYYSISNNAFDSEFEAALLDFYGSGVTIESAGSGVVFQCPAICDKQLTISYKKAQHYPHYYLYGVVDGVEFNGININQYGFSSGNAAGPIHLVLSDSFMLIQHRDSGRPDHSTNILVAKVTNGRHLCMGAYHGTIEYGRCYFTDDLTTDRPVRFITPRTDIAARSKGKIPCYKSAFVVGEEMEVNPDGSVAHIDGLYLTMFANHIGAVGINYFMSVGILRGSGSQGVYMPNAFYVPIEHQE